MKSLLASLGAAFVAAALTGSAAAEAWATGALSAIADAERDSQRPVSVVVPTPEFPTIQRGIDAVPDGGTVLVRPGVYQETLAVVGKRVILQGSGTRGEQEQTILFGADSERGVITFGLNGGGTVKSMVIRGGAYGIAGEDRFPAPVEIKDVVIERTGRGVYGTYSDLTIKAVTIQDTSWNSISLLEAFQSFVMSNTVLIQSGNIGLLIFNHVEGGSVIKIGAALLGHPGGGIVIHGDGKDVEIDHSYIVGNHFAGVRLMHSSHNLIKDTVISNTFTRVSDGLYGDGVMAVCSDVTVLGSNPVPESPHLPIFGSNLIEFSARAAVSAFGSAVGVGNTLFNHNVIDINTEPYPCDPGAEPTPTHLDDLEGNVCGAFTPEGFANVLCQNKSLNMQPPEAVDTP